MIRRSLYALTFCAVVITVACGQNAEFTGEGANTFGESITTDNAKPLASLIDQVTEDTMNVTVTGMINEVCQAKGCWMTLEDDGSNESVFIKFKDYGFFVPLKAGGKKAVVRGKLYASITPVDELRHYAEDKGASKEEIAAITEPEKEIKMMADGVVIYNE